MISIQQFLEQINCLVSVYCKGKQQINVIALKFLSRFVKKESLNPDDYATHKL